MLVGRLKIRPCIATICKMQQVCAFMTTIQFHETIE